MKKRDFLKTTSALVTGSLMAPLASCTSQDQSMNQTQARQNWAGNLTYSTDNLHQPSTVEQVQEAVRQCDQLRALGTRHCFNAIADSKANQLSLKQMIRVVDLDTEAQTVTVEGGINYGQLCPYLHERGFALHNLASLPHISVAGASATATHGSGMNNGNLSTAVVGLELVKADGELVKLTKEQDGDNFAGAVVHLGGLGVVTKLTLKVQPAYQMRQDVYLDLPLDQLEENFEDIMGSGYSVSLFTDWQPGRVNQVWRKRLVDENNPIEAGPEFYGAKLADRNVHPILDHSAESCTEQMGVPGAWYERLPHFKMEFTPSSGKELQTEYFVPRAKAPEAFQILQQMGEQLAPLLMISEIRSIDADDFWMSPCYQQPCIAFHFTWEQDAEALQQLLPVIEKKLAPFDARPHWGKVFGTSPELLASLYPKLPDFQVLLREYDPDGKFSNAYLQRNIWNEQV